jgi:hypothetical protein
MPGSPTACVGPKGVLETRPVYYTVITLPTHAPIYSRQIILHSCHISLDRYSCQIILHSCHLSLDIYRLFFTSVILGRLDTAVRLFFTAVTLVWTDTAVRLFSQLSY